MRNAKVLVALAVGLCALAGCGSGVEVFGAGGSSSTASSPSSTESTSPPASGLPPGSATLPSSNVRPPGQSQVPTQPPQSSATPLPGGATEVPPARVDGTVLPETYKSQVQVSADGKTLLVIGQAGGCKTATAEVTAESADQVQITLVTTYYAPRGGLCTQEIRDVPLNVTLKAPLGDRRIVLEARQEAA